uniref:Uncharacterized protein n=1 Tax=Salix viminalis TaxID=40686 RepID=A0A6N2N8X9_SALVM
MASNYLQIIKWYLAMQGQMAYAIQGCAGLDEIHKNPLNLETGNKFINRSMVMKTQAKSEFNCLQES